MPRTIEHARQHMATIESSPRLQKGRDYFKEVKTATTLDMIKAGIAASPRDLVRALRVNGMNIVTEFERTTDNGSRVFRYTLW